MVVNAQRNRLFEVYSFISLRRIRIIFIEVFDGVTKSRLTLIQIYVEFILLKESFKLPTPGFRNAKKQTT